MNPLSRFLYPDPDALTITGSNNSSYWLVLFAQSDFLDSWRTLYYVGTLLLLSGMCLHGRSVFLFWQNKILHPYFLAIGTNFYVSVQVGSLSRIALIVYEAKVIDWTDINATFIPQIAMLRQFGLAICYGLLIGATCERVAATLLVADYEQRPRFYIPTLIIASVDIFFVVMSYYFVAGIVNVYMFCIFGALPNIGLAVILRLMLRHNERRLARLSDTLHRYPHDRYSLSLRVQLKENIWSLQKIEFGVVVLILAIVCNLALVIGPVAFLSRRDQMKSLQWTMWAGNLIVAISLSAKAPIGSFAIALHTGARPFYVRWYLRHFTNNVVSPEVKQVDAYFGQLQGQWNFAMTKRFRMRDK